MSDACCAAGTLVYTNNAPAAGSVERCAGSDHYAEFDAYVVGSGTTALVVGTDIFGFAVSNTRANADMLASALGCLVIVPDHFRGHTITSYLDGADFTPAAIGGFIQSHGGWEATKADLLGAVAPLAAAAGAVRLFYLGFCWGGKIALHIAADEQASALFVAVGGVHASLKDREGDLARATAARVPVMLLQARNDLDVRPVAEALAGGPLAVKHLVRTYHDQLHGWAAARGDRSDPRVAAAVRGALQTAVDFFSLSFDAQ